MDTELEKLVAAVRTVFDETASRLGLEGPIIIYHNLFFVLAYFGEDLGLKVVVERVQFFIFAAPFKSLGKSRVPEGLEDLQTLLTRLGISHQEERHRLQALGGNENNAAPMAKVLAALVERTWNQVLVNADKIRRLIPEG